MAPLRCMKCLHAFKNLLQSFKCRNSRQIRFQSISKLVAFNISPSSYYFNRSFSIFSPNKCATNVFDFNQESESKAQVLGKIETKLFLGFTCKKCNARIEKHVSKVAYTKGVVIIRCDSCEENHLIADNLGWFPNLKSMRNIEGIMAARGETVKKTVEEVEPKTDN